MMLVVKKSTLSRKGSLLIVSWGDKKVEVPIGELELLVIVGSNVTLTSDIINFLSSSNVPVLIHGKDTDTVLVTPFINRISEVRRKFYERLSYITDRLYVAKRLIKAKIEGMINLVRYFSYVDKVDVEIPSFDWSRINDEDTLRKAEAQYSKECWDLLKRFLPSDFPGRKPRNLDPINRAIDYAYSIIYMYSTHALIASGLDPYAGVLHVDKPGRPSLTYDFSEMFKPIAVHSVIATVRRSALSISKNGYLTNSSLEVLSNAIYGKLHEKRKGKRSYRGEIYATAERLKKWVVENTEFVPFVYKPK